MPIISTEQFALPGGKTKIPREFLENRNISFKAKGVFAYILSCPDGEFTVADIVKATTDGRDLVYGCLNELIEHGYIVRRRLRDNDGKLCGMCHDVYPFGRGFQEDFT